MRQPRRSPLQLSLLTCAIAAAGMSQAALAVDLCVGNAATTVSTAHPGDSCNLNTLDATLKVLATGRIGLGVDVNADGVRITNAGDILGSQVGVHYLGSHAIAMLANSGDITVSGGSQAAGISSNGTVDVAGRLANSGRITASATGSTQADATGIFIADDVAGQLANSGRISATASADSASAYGIFIDHQVTGSLSNSGAVSASATASASSAYAAGIELGGSLEGTLTNSGRVTASVSAGSSSATAYGIRVNGGGLGAAASLVNSGRVEADSHTTNGFANGFGLRASGVIAGDITNSATGMISATSVSDSDYASAFGVYLGQGISDGGSLTNKGTVLASATGHDSAYATGLRLLAHNASSGSGIFSAAMSGNASIVNSGTITGEGAAQTASGMGWALWLSGDMRGSSSIANSGSLVAVGESVSGEALATSLFAYNLLDNSAIQNSGTISARAASVSASASAYGILASTMGGNATIGNSGTIRASASGGTDVNASGIGVSSMGGNAAISNSGLIDARAEDGGSSLNAYGIHAGALGSTATISNTGRIVATAAGESGDNFAYGIRTGALSGSAGILNTGAITARIDDSQGAGSAWAIRTDGVGDGATLANAGKITVDLSNQTGWGVGVYVVGTVGPTAQVSNTGTITAVARGGDVSVSGLWINGTILDGGSVANSGVVRATATATTGSAWAWGWASSGTQGELVNTGTIVATASAATSAGAEALWSSANDGGVVRNSGTLVALANGDDSALAEALYTSTSINGSLLENTGTMIARAVTWGSSGAVAYGIYGNALDASSTINNTGLISATAAGNGTSSAYGIYMQTFSGTLTNSGVIAARTSTNSNGEVYALRGVNAGAGSVDNSGVMLGGVYLPGSTSVNNSGSLASYASSPSLVGGNYTQSGASALLGISLRDTATVGGLTVGGTADFTAGDRVVVAFDPHAQISDGDVFNNVIGAGSLAVDGDGLTLTDTSRFWDFAVSTDATSVDLTANFLGVARALAGSGMTLTASQIAYLDGVVQGTYPQLSDLSGALNAAPTAQAVAALVEQAGPAMIGANSKAARSASSAALAALSARQGETRGAASGDAAGANSVWLKPFIAQASQDAAEGLSGYDVDSAGFILGADGNVSDNWRVGVAVAAAQGKAEGDYADIDIDTTQLALYGTYSASDSTWLDLSLNAASNGYDSRRRLGFTGATARAGYDGSQFGLAATASTRNALGQASAFVPSLTVRYQRVDLEGYTETGAGAYDLAVADQREDSLLWAAKGTFEFGLGGGTLLASAGAGYDTLNAPSATATVGGVTGPTYVAHGAKPDSTVLTGGLGYRHVTAQHLEISAAYDVESRGDFMAQSLSLKFLKPF